MASFPFQSPSAVGGATPTSSTNNAYPFPLSPTSTLPSQPDIESLPLDALGELENVQQPGPDTPVVLKSLNTYVSPLPSANGGSYETSVSGDNPRLMADPALTAMITRLKKELKMTQDDLVKAVQGWREDRGRFKKQLEDVANSTSAKQMKLELTAEKKRLRGVIAQVQSRCKSLEADRAVVVKGYEEKIADMNKRLLEAESRKSQQKANHRRQSVELSKVVKSEKQEREQKEQHLRQKSAEVTELSTALEKCLEQISVMSTDLNESQSSQVSLEAKVAQLERENTSLKNQLKNRITRPGRKPPKVPDFDFRGLSDTKVETVLNQVHLERE